MDLSPKQYLFIYLLVIAPVVISFFIRRKNAPTRLNLTGQDPEKEPKQTVPIAQPPPATPPAKKTDLASEIRKPPPRRQRGEYPPPRVEPLAEKSLNAFFNWNGHSWDAFEVLGIPAGSSAQAAQVAYQELITRSAPDSHDFYKAAYDTIVRKA